jgi:hypothetical protein
MAAFNVGDPLHLRQVVAAQNPEAKSHWDTTPNDRRARTSVPRFAEQYLGPG